MGEERSRDERELEQHGRLRLGPLGRPLADLASGAAFLRHMLPEIGADLGAIRRHVASMDPEMVGMHAAVRRIEGEIAQMNDRIGELSEHMNAVELAVARLEPHVADVNLAVRPFRRARARMRPPHDPEEAAADDIAGEQTEGSG